MDLGSTAQFPGVLSYPLNTWRNSSKRIPSHDEDFKMATIDDYQRDQDRLFQRLEELAKMAAQAREAERAAYVKRCKNDIRKLALARG
jgi:response regulator RpfG family c-di-GMP phosphodiesterase